MAAAAQYAPISGHEEMRRGQMSGARSGQVANFSLPSPSVEQLEVIQGFQAGYNLKVEAVAGSGKTTTLLWLCLVAKRDFGVNCLILTYNKTLEVEINSKLELYGLQTNCAALTFHGFASRIY